MRKNDGKSLPPMKGEGDRRSGGGVGHRKPRRESRNPSVTRTLRRFPVLLDISRATSSLRVTNVNFVHMQFTPIKSWEARGLVSLFLHYFAFILLFFSLTLQRTQKFQNRKFQSRAKNAPSTAEAVPLPRKRMRL